MTRNRFSAAAALLAVVLLAGCAAGRTVVPSGIDSGRNPSQGQAVRIESVQDQRTFIVNPPSPDTPSLMDNDEIRNTAITSRAVGRKRGGFGAALGDVLLPEGQTVQMLVESAVTRALRESGYRVVERGSPGHAQAIPIAVRIDQFWSWFNPGFWAVTVSFRGSIYLRGALPKLNEGRVVSAHVQDQMQAVLESDWQKIVDRGLEALVRETKLLLGSAPKSESGRDGTVQARAEEKPKPTVESTPTTVRNPSTTASVAAAPSSLRPAPPASEPDIGPGGLRAGDRWEYTFTDSRKGRPAARKFQITRVAASTIGESIELEDGKTLFATHHRGAYLTMTGGMQYAPYYLAFQDSAMATGRIADIRAEGGDACAMAPTSIYNTYSCEVSATFEGREHLAVPAGTFDAHRVRVEVFHRVHGSTAAGLQSGVVAVGNYWISAESGRLLKAVVRFDTEQPWTETLELVSLTAAGGAVRRADR